MAARLLKMICCTIVGFALFAPVVRADPHDTDINITMLGTRPDDLQAGGNPNFHLYMRFCNPGFKISITPTPGGPGQFRVVNTAATTLRGPIDAAAKTITVASTADFTASGTLLIDSEQMTYEGKTPTTFTGVTR